MATAAPHFMEESGTSQHHGELTAVVGVVEPATVSHVVGVEATGEADQLISGLAPHPVCVYVCVCVCVCVYVCVCV